MEAGVFLSCSGMNFAPLESVEKRSFYLREPLNVVYLPAPTQSVVVSLLSLIGFRMGFG